MKDTPALLWWFEVGWTQALGYRVLITAPQGLLTPEAYREQLKVTATGGRKRKRKAA